MHRPALALAFPLALALTLGACTSSGGGVSGASAPPSSAPTASHSSSPALSASDLELSMVSAKDLPSGWSRDEQSENDAAGPTDDATGGLDEEGPGAPCGIDELMGYEPRGESYRYFVKGSPQTGSSVDIDAIALADLTQARTVFTQLQSNLITCDAWQDEDFGDGTVAEMSADPVGDESGAVTVRFDDEEAGPFAIEVRYVRVGTVVMISVGDGAEGAPTQDQGKILEAQVTKLRAALASATAAPGRDV